MCELALNELKVILKVRVQLGYSGEVNEYFSGISGSGQLPESNELQEEYF
jgi:hypothetical protein